MTERAEGTLERLANQILESVEQIANRVEEGFSVLLTGKLPGDQDQSSTRTPGNARMGIDDDEMMEIDEDMLGSPLEGIADSVLKDIMDNQVGPQTPMEHFHAFRSAITWTEPFILSLIAFQILAFFLCIWVSQKGRGMVPRFVIMSVIAILVRCSELLNGYAARNWQSFSTQNYFDRQGIFMGIFVCGPLLLDCFIMLTLLIREASQLLVEVKKMEIERKKEREDNKGRGKKSKQAKKED